VSDAGCRWTGEVRVNEKALQAGPPSMRDGGVLFVCDMGDLFHDLAPVQWVSEVLSKLAALPASIHPMLLTKRQWQMRDQMRLHTNGRASTRIWCGVTCENQDAHDQRVPVLRETPCAGHFLSCEPLLGHIDLDLRGISWVIVGGEAGPGARLCDVQDVESIVGQCERAGVPVFVKQLGSDVTNGTTPLRLGNRKGADMGEWPESLRIRQTPWDGVANA